MSAIKKRIHEIVDVAQNGDRLSLAFDIFILSMIALNMLALVLESVDEIGRAFPRAFSLFETVSVAVFSIEYILRVWTCTMTARYRGTLGRVRFIFSFMALVDFLAILPFYLPFVDVDMRFVRSIRLLRIFRVVKIGRYSKSLQTIGKVVRAKRPELLTTIFVLAILLLIASSGIYFAERDAQPEKFSSIPASMWWGIATLTTIGYGDVYPVTAFGKIFASAIAVLGVGMVALPTGIIGSGFIEELNSRHRKKESKKCPHCGGVFEE